MAVDAFIYFTYAGKVAVTVPVGETLDAAMKTLNAFEIKEFSFDCENPHSVGSATSGAGTGKAKFGEFTIKKPTDKASTIFFKNACSGAHYTTAQIICRKSGAAADGAGAPYLQFAFGMVFTTKIEWSGPGDEGPEESITFAFGQLAVQYWKQDTDGALVSPPFTTNWDSTKNQPWASPPAFYAPS